MPTYLGSVGPFKHFEVAFDEALEGVILLMFWIDELCPRFSQEYWEFVESHPNRGKSGSNVHFDEAVPKWLERWGLRDWVNPNKPMDLDPYFLNSIIYPEETFQDETLDEVESSWWYMAIPLYEVWDLPRRRARERSRARLHLWDECERDRKLAPLYMQYGKGRMRDHIQQAIENGWNSVAELVHFSQARAPVYNPLMETRGEYTQRTKKYLKEVERKARILGAVKATRINNPLRNFEWLARRVVLGETPAKIALRYDEEQEKQGVFLDVTDTEDSVKKAIQRSADLIGLKLPQGRPLKK